MPEPEGDHGSVRILAEVLPNTLGQLEKQLDGLLQSHPEVISLDCSEVDYLTSSHVKLLWAARTRCAESGTALRLTSASHYVWKVLDVLNLSEFFIPEEDEAPPAPNDQPVGFDSMETYEDTFPTDVDDINFALKGFLLFLRTAGLPTSTQYVLRTLFYEVATNIRLHASADHTEPIHFSAVLQPSQIVLTFVDHGPPFDPTQFDLEAHAATKDMDDRRSFGLEIIRKLVDRLAYQRLDDTRNVLVLQRNWRIKKWTGAASHNAR